MPLITVERHKYSMVDIKTVISSKHRLRLIDSITSMVITIKTTDLKRHRLYPTETHENRRQSTILPMKSFVWVDLDPYGGTDTLGMFPLFLKRTADVLAPVLV